jgi:hypothetical protein
MTLETEYAYATECQLATLEGLKSRKSSAKSEIARQEAICSRMLRICRSLSEHSLELRGLPRVAGFLNGTEYQEFAGDRK